ncbi:MAG: 2-oxoglutarate dehydrogenase E1 component, partial [Chloroflexota bacterium]
MSNQDLWPSSDSLAYVEALYQTYLSNPEAVDPHWRRYFEQWPGGNGRKRPATLKPTFQPRSIFNPTGNGRAGALGAPRISPREAELSSLQHRVDQLIRNYRVRGHIVARLDPLGTQPEEPPELDPAYYGFTETDMDRLVYTSSLPGPRVRTLRDILDHLRETYCRDIGVQFMHIDNLQVREWLQERMESTRNKIELSRKE